jgi:hypothetical protein
VRESMREFLGAEMMATSALVLHWSCFELVRSSSGLSSCW